MEGKNDCGILPPAHMTLQVLLERKPAFGLQLTTCKIFGRANRFMRSKPYVPWQGHFNASSNCSAQVLISPLFGKFFLIAHGVRLEASDKDELDRLLCYRPPILLVFGASGCASFYSSEGSILTYSATRLPHFAERLFRSGDASLALEQRLNLTTVRSGAYKSPALPEAAQILQRRMGRQCHPIRYELLNE
jgi:hypothetical protein